MRAGPHVGPGASGGAPGQRAPWFTSLRRSLRQADRQALDSNRKPAVLYIVNVRKRHPKPEVEDTLAFAEASGWTVRDTPAGHKWGDMRCPEASRDGCRESIWSTPKNAGNHAKRLKARVGNCPHVGDGHD